MIEERQDKTERNEKQEKLQRSKFKLSPNGNVWNCELRNSLREREARKKRAERYAAQQQAAERQKKDPQAKTHYKGSGWRDLPKSNPPLNNREHQTWSNGGFLGATRSPARTPILTTPPTGPTGTATTASSPSSDQPEETETEAPFICHHPGCRNKKVVTVYRLQSLISHLKGRHHETEGEIQPSNLRDPSKYNSIIEALRLTGQNPKWESRKG